jgi:hypothetical protein
VGKQLILRYFTCIKKINIFPDRFKRQQVLKFKLEKGGVTSGGTAKASS